MPPPVERMVDAAVEAWCLDLDAAVADLDRCLAMLDEEERARADRFRVARDRDRYILRRGLLRERLAHRLGCAPARIRYIQNAWGKPSLEVGDLRFNLSHSRGLALCVIAHREVGCDIEWRNPQLAVEPIAARFFSARELAALRALDRARWARAFFNAWTRKEAYIKARGRGLSLALDSFDVSLAPDEPAALLRGCDGWSVRAFEPAPGYHAAVVAEGTDWQLLLDPLSTAAL